MTDSQPLDDASSARLLDAIRVECRRVEEDATFSARGHFEAARTWGRVHLFLGIPTSVLAAVASVSAFNDLPLLAGALAILVSGLSAVSTFLNPAEKGQAHHLAGTMFTGLRSQVRYLREVASLTGETPRNIASSLQTLIASKDDLNSKSPMIPRPAFQRARKGIEGGEASYAVDAGRIEP